MQVCWDKLELNSAGHRPSRIKFDDPWSNASLNMKQFMIDYFGMTIIYINMLKSQNVIRKTKSSNPLFWIIDKNNNKLYIHRLKNWI